MKNTILLLFFTLFINFCYTQTKDYKDLWQIVERHEIEGLPKSALKTVEDILTKAQKDQNEPQLIKAMIFKSKFALVLEEEAQLNVINNFKTQIEESVFPTKNILENMLAQLYWQYFQQNRWKIYNRTKTTDKIDPIDFRTWDLETLFNEIHVSFQNSLQNGLMLQLEPLSKYDAILNTQKDSKIYRPTLFDFLNHNALEFYQTNETQITKPAYKFEIDNPEFLGDAQTFSSLKIESKDTTSLQLHALKIYQDLIQFHLKDESPKALTNVNIERLRFVNQHATFKDAEAILLKAFKTESDHHKNHEVSALYDFEIASILQQQSKNYNPTTKKEFRWKAKEAVELCNKVISKFPDSKGAEKCKILKEQIEQKSLNISTESFLPTQKHARVLVSYKNLDTLIFKAYRLNESQFEKINKTYRQEEKWALISNLNVDKTWESKLRNESDYHTHSTEVLIPKLNNGRYLIVASTAENEEDFYASAHIQVTNIALADIENDTHQIFQLINRNNGAPIVNASVEISYNIRYSNTKKIRIETSDSNGNVIIPKDETYYRNMALKVKANNETAYFGNYWMGNRQEPDDIETHYQAFIFTDRSIYRPGQTVYFKAIAIQTQKGISKVIPNELFYVDVFDSNDEEVAELEFTTNEFGSISGEFILPNNGLNGKYYIELWSDSDKIDIDMEHSFSVEEYKRPKFETKFKPITETFKINDSVTTTGTALAYAGSNITNAKVVYRVHRKVQYPRWYFWYRPRFNSEPQEITHGETTTDDKGEFEITFKAQPDQSVDKNSLPVFKYEVTADVTDINGETRSATTVINVGYHALNARIDIDDKLDKSKKDHSITIDTKNLNGEFVPAAGTIKVYKLKAPNRVLRKRLWAAPDYQEFSEEAFKNLFPHDAYTNEDNPENWEKGDVVFEKLFDTNISKTIELDKIKKWLSGQYLMVLESKDKFGQTVKDQAKITLFSDDDKSLADNQIFGISSNKLNYEVGETAYVTIASAAENISVTVTVEKDKKIIQTEIIQLNNNKKVISIPVTDKDVGGFVVHYSTSVFNSFLSGTHPIAVPYPETELTIETKTFRDRLQPGTDETWSFNIEGPKGDKVSAELLASMYDASLDQFKPHAWDFNPIHRGTYYSSYRIDSNQSFGTRTFTIHNSNKNRPSYTTQYYDEFNWFGFSMRFNKWLYDNYIENLRIKRSKEFHENIKEGFISGTIRDKDGLPLPGATVMVKGTTNGTTTDFDGNFSIKASNNDELVISYVGFETQGVIVDRKRLNISLFEDNAQLDEVVVVGYGTVKKESVVGSISAVKGESLQGAIPGVTAIQGSGFIEADDKQIFIRGQASWNDSKKPLVIVDGKIIEGDFDTNMADIQSIDVLKDISATAIYGARGANGVILITTKSGLNALTQVQVRKNLKETAFFFPHLKTDENGNVNFSFTTPEALTQWKLQLLAHTKNLESATTTLKTVTQKELMVIPNAPRFLREGDQITISTKIANLTENQLHGQSLLVLTDAITGKKVDSILGNTSNLKTFSINAKGNTSVSWNVSIPNGIQAIQYKVIAKTEDFSDGEQNALPVLSNRMLVTETLPMWIKSNETRTFTLDKLKNVYSTTLKHHKLTLEMTSNPAWYAVQALPYLMEYPYQCNEQTFSRYYTNALASHIVNSNPRIQEVFNQWKSQEALMSNLEKNEELKSIIIQETPWLRDAQSETKQKKRMALLFDLNKMNNELQLALDKLENNQLSSGAWAWFKGGHENRWITQHIITGFGHLKHLNVTQNGAHEYLTKRALNYLDEQFIKEYKDLRKYDAKRDLSKDHLSYMQLHYLYMRSFFPEIEKSQEVEEISKYYLSQIQQYWLKRSLYAKGLMALVCHRNDDAKTAAKILKSLKESSITNEELGMYWKENTNSWYWYQAPIETQALIIEAFSESGSVIQSEAKNLETIDNLKIWLLKNKQTNKWKTTKATTEAVYALLLQGSDWLSVSDMVDVAVGNEKIEPSKLDDVKIEAGTGYFKTSWNTSEIKPEMAEVKLTKKGDGIAWGGLYWQYFEDLDKITSAETPIQLKKKLFLKRNTDTGEEITEITSETNLEVGDLVRVRIELKSDRAMEFVHMKDMRAAGLEPVNVLSKYKWQDGLGYYESTKDASTNFFFDFLPKGIYVFEYDLRVNNAGNMSNGITTIQSMYAPEYSSHSEGVRLHVQE
ncbi:alpha-2-macroglobulin family protein [Seonamhaeicola aphaedonensis]|uniref:TonB-dependent SusC/RagA subfamily outer membrane receptor n=1 Tax=Seonamhaeicola aphaedonensis TaxID=1461338 RepID=A0A3D9HKQ2_9FLAO|nr:carboxypeptidase-like regulatory domain-containing protein [Seonamhaeicola aphaedonensis]RED50054.1 TonB-dependent SusC/RagA subfamily outer membrane receptor [Seonamhaeicola aphaedonensis]